MGTAIAPDACGQAIVERIPVYQPYLAGNVSRYVNDCLESGWISSRGEFVAKFENTFADVIGANQATSVANGTVAIHLVLTALGIGPGDEVIVPTLTYVATVNMILQVGATPVFVDSLEDTLQMDAVAVELAVTCRTKAIMAVHLYGHPCDMTSVVALCQRHDLSLIEDCAEAFGSAFEGRHVGSFGDAATFSFFGNKTITTGEGGMVVIRDSEIMKRCRSLKNQGVSATREYWHDVLAYNYRMTNIQAAIGLAQLEMASEILSLKAEVARAYRVGLAQLPLRTHEPIGNVRHSYWMCSVILNRPQDRDPLRAHLAERGIETRPFFPPTHMMPHCRVEADFPISSDLSTRGINLPSYPGLKHEQVSRICGAIRSFWS